MTQDTNPNIVDTTMSTPALPPAQQPQPPAPAPSHAELEYRNLRDYLERIVRWTLIAISALVTVAAVLFYQNLSDARKDARDAIQATRETTNLQINAMGEAAKTEAQRVIAAELDKENVRRMIESTAQRKVDAAVDEAVRRNLESRIEAFRALTTKIGEVSSHGAQLRAEFRDGLDGLLKDSKDPDPTVRAYAHSTLAAIAADYEMVLKTNPPFPTLIPANLPPKGLMGIIRGDRTPPRAGMRVAEAFTRLKTKFQWDVQTFDIPAAEKWCATHEPKCDEDFPKQ